MRNCLGVRPQESCGTSQDRHEALAVALNVDPGWRLALNEVSLKLADPIFLRLVPRE